MNYEQFNKFVAFCAKCHEGQYRKDGMTPYFSPPARVATSLQRYYPKATLSDLAIAYGHDLIEDCISDQQLKEELIKLTDHIDYIYYGIDILSEDKNIKPRSERKEDYLNDLIFYGDEKILITKLIDRYDNLMDDGMQEGFLQETYLDESEELLNRIVNALGYKPPISIELERKISELKEN